ncbi:MAG: DUF1810 domain-containing protein [Clostridiales bacterium]|nr:DUF1810 domain-containing protein [Clostridiales bacterium]
MTDEVRCFPFYEAHQIFYNCALKEIQGGRKRTHWMWFIFPQLRALARSPMAERFSICDLGEAQAFLADPYLGGNLREISQALLTLDTHDPLKVFPEPDDRKLQRCMTLFAYASGGKQVFLDVLQQSFDGWQDERTLKLLEQPRQ